MDKADAFDARRRPHDAAGARRQAPARDRREPQSEPTARSGGAGDAPSRKSGWIDLGARARCRSSRAREWRQMLREVWRLQRDQFWVADMSGVDWDAV